MPTAISEQSSKSVTPPQVKFRSITFSGGQTITLEPDDIVVLVGPNNAGKSAALRELQHRLSGSHIDPFIFNNTQRTRVGTASDLRSYLEVHARRSPGQKNLHYSGMGYDIPENHIEFFNSDESLRHISSFFSSMISTVDRITGSDPAGPFLAFSEGPTHPIHQLLEDSVLAKTISDIFKRAFSTDLTVLRAGASHFPLHVGKKPKVLKGKDELDRDFLESLVANTEQLGTQGDGMRSFTTVVLYAILSTHHSVQFLEEPEAFLHPPQARLLGKILATERRASSQLFVATHSTDILEGIAASASSRVKIIRIDRQGQVNNGFELDRKLTERITNDPLLMYSGVLRGVFYRHVFIVESDADCLFYSSLLNTKAVSGEGSPDVLFLHASGKHRLAQLAEVLKNLAVPISVICDFDILREDSVVRPLFEILGGDWSTVSKDISVIQNHISSKVSKKRAQDFLEQVEKVVKEQGVEAPLSSVSRKKIGDAMRTQSPWDFVKQAGRSA